MIVDRTPAQKMPAGSLESREKERAARTQHLSIQSPSENLKDSQVRKHRFIRKRPVDRITVRSPILADGLKIEETSYKSNSNPHRSEFTSSCVNEPAAEDREIWRECAPTRVWWKRKTGGWTLRGKRQRQRRRTRWRKRLGMVDRYPEFAPEREKERVSAQRTHRERERERDTREKERVPSLAAHRHDRGGIAKLSTSSF
ncbi:hypothetical protein ALC60_00209 [Trachymyrmex zeteki]|uniref:Uncharacterized protein n=1 Tax=Mycetomoellerius zeteki TaxID=64791 RepID=A0A151XK16_9HYME|nr:hypothetical protein ALC60_00209 [Trachymyrmex zeteki]